MATKLFIVLAAYCIHVTFAQQGPSEMLKQLQNTGRHFFSYSPEEKQRDDDLKWRESIVSGDTLSFRPWKQASGHNVTIASMFIGESAKSWASVQRNHITFARKFGYNYFAPFGTKNFVYGAYDRANRHPTWSKMAIIQCLFDQGSDAVFWMDGDSLFMNGQDNIDKFVKMNKDLVFSGDQNVMFNAGHFLMRKSHWSQWFMRDAYSICPAPGVWMDNSAMLVMLAGGSPREPAHWPDVLTFGMKNCTTALQSSHQCSHGIAEGLKQHVQNLEQDAMNSYTPTSMIFRSPLAQRPFIVHRVFTHKDERSRDLPKLAALAQCALQEMSERQCQATLDGVDEEQEDESHEEGDQEEEAEDEGTTSFESDVSDESDTDEELEEEQKKGASLRGKDVQRHKKSVAKEQKGAGVARKVSKADQVASSSVAAKKDAQPATTKKGEVLYLPKRVNGVQVLFKDGKHRWRAENRIGAEDAYGIDYRASKSLNDRVGGRLGPHWGDSVEAVDEGDGWLRVKTRKEKVENNEEEWEKLHTGITRATNRLHKAMGYQSFIHTSWDILDHTC